MDVGTETSPSYFDPEDLSVREQFRRYGKRPLGSSVSPSRDKSASRFSNAALFLENIKHEVENFDAEYLEGMPAKIQSPSKRRSSIDSRGISEVDVAGDSFSPAGIQSLKAIKNEGDEAGDRLDSTFSLFASLLDSAFQGLMTIPDLILRLETACRSVSESIRYGNTERHRIVEDKLIRQKARMLLDEAASWSLIWYLYGKASAHLEACQFVAVDYTAQICLRIIQWLEGLASKALDLDNKVQGSHVGTYLPSSGVWNHTQRFLKKGVSNAKTVCHLDFDAPTREHAQQLSDDKKQDESLLEDVWTLLKAGILEDACNLCRSAGQPWRAPTLCPFGGFHQSPSTEAPIKNGKNRILQAIELESGIGHQWHLWKWASYRASEKISEHEGGKYETAIYASQCSNLKRLLPFFTEWESACWAMAKSWLDVQVDLELARPQPGGMDQFKSLEDAMERGPAQADVDSQPIAGPENWPLQVLNQQPRNLSALLQKLHSSDSVHETVTRGCKEQQQQIQMNLMLVDIPHLLDLIWWWMSSSEDDLRPHGDPQMIRFGAHLVLVLRYLLADELKDAFKEKIMTLGDLILQYLPFSPGNHLKGSFEEIVERVLSRSREIKIVKYDKLSDVAEQCRLQSLQKAMVIQWLCFKPSSTINDAQIVSPKLLLRALMHREFALISMWRVSAMPIGAHTLLSLLAEPLKQPTESLFTADDQDVSDCLIEFEDWSEYYSCDATYRNWLKIELENAEVSPHELSNEEKQNAATAASETINSSFSLLLSECLHLSNDSCSIEVVLRCLAVVGDGLGRHEFNDGGVLATVIVAGFKGELVRSQAGVTMEISRLDASYSGSEGSIEGPATYILRGLCRRCCIPEVILRCMQVLLPGSWRFM